MTPIFVTWKSSGGMTLSGRLLGFSGTDAIIQPDAGGELIAVPFFNVSADPQ